MPFLNSLDAQTSYDDVFRFLASLSIKFIASGYIILFAVKYWAINLSSFLECLLFYYLPVLAIFGGLIILLVSTGIWYRNREKLDDYGVNESFERLKQSTEAEEEYPGIVGQTDVEVSKE